MNPAEQLVYLSALLFSIGLAVVIIKKNTIMMLLGIELMLNASNLNFVEFNRHYASSIDGQIFALFVIVIAVCEAAVGLAIVLRIYHYYQTSIPDEVSDLKN